MNELELDQWNEGESEGEEVMMTRAKKLQRQELAGVEMKVWRGWRDRLVKRQ